MLTTSRFEGNSRATKIHLDSPQDIAAWVEERRKRFPRTQPYIESRSIAVDVQEADASCNANHISTDFTCTNTPVLTARDIVDNGEISSNFLPKPQDTSAPTDTGSLPRHARGIPPKSAGSVGKITGTGSGQLQGQAQRAKRRGDKRPHDQDLTNTSTGRDIIPKTSDLSLEMEGATAGRSIGKRSRRLTLYQRVGTLSL